MRLLHIMVERAEPSGKPYTISGQVELAGFVYYFNLPTVYEPDQTVYCERLEK